jgi:hypothetical protein
MRSIGLRAIGIGRRRYVTPVNDRRGVNDHRWRIVDHWRCIISRRAIVAGGVVRGCSIVPAGGVITVGERTPRVIAVVVSISIDKRHRLF